MLLYKQDEAVNKHIKNRLYAAKNRAKSEQNSRKLCDKQNPQKLRNGYVTLFEKENITMRITKQAIEQADYRADVLEQLESLGKQFMKHFIKVVNEGPEAPTFSHHCKEMQDWFNKAKEKRLKQDGKTITNTNLVDWFFSARRSPEDFIKNGLILDIYEQFYPRLLVNRKAIIEDILRENALLGIKGLYRRGLEEASHNLSQSLARIKPLDTIFENIQKIRR